MAVLPILRFPDPRLRTIAKPVQSITDDIKHFAQDLKDTLYASSGIGLAATQVNRHIQMLIIDLSETQDAATIFINPSFTSLNHDMQHEYQEGCLSIPATYESVQRYANIQVTALDLKGQSFSVPMEGLEAVCFQHEYDHLQGKLFIDSLSELKRQRIRKKMQKY